MAAFIGVGVVGRSRQNGRVSRCSRRRVVRMEADDGGEKKVSPFSEQVDLSTPIKTEFNPGKKSAKEFAEEGIQDEVKSGIRFESITGGIVDDYDPFKEEAKTQKAVEDASEDAMGEIVEVTADGTVTKEILTRGSGPRISPGDTVKVSSKVTAHFRLLHSHIYLIFRRVYLLCRSSCSATLHWYAGERYQV